MRSTLFSLAVVLLLGSSAALAEAPTRSELAAPSPQATVVLPEVAAADDLYFVALPAEQVRQGSRLDIVVLADGETLVAESLVLTEVSTEGGKVGVELFADDASVRQLLASLSDESKARVDAEVWLDSQLVERLSLTELEQTSARVLERGLLPSATRPGDVVNFDDEFIPVCGDGVCNNNNPIPELNEDCEICPEDCGNEGCSICGNGYCGFYEDCNTCSADCGSCPVCPQVIGTETRTQLLSSTSLGWQCLQDYIFWNQSVLYDYTKYDYKRFTVERERQCNGTITETVVPGSTSYFSVYCYRYTGIPCFGGFFVPGCVTF
ncbi:MAG: hypothetical protein AAGC60_20590 [Acidobacteriota bacterium]